MALPGVRTVLKDRFYTLSRTNLPDTIRLAVIARRNNDVLMENPDYVDATDTPDEPEFIPTETSNGDPVAEDFSPFLARSEDQVIDHFGEGSELHRGYLEATSGGAPRVYLVSWGSTDTTASNAAADTDLTDDTETGAFHQAFDAVESVQADIIVPWGRGGHADDGTNDAKDFGFRADNASTTTDSLAIRVANRCKEITDRSNPCFAVMGVTPIEGQDDVKSSDLQTHFTFPNLVDREQVENSYTVVIATEVEMTQRNQQEFFDAHGWSNGAATYAGFLANIDSENAATGKNLFNIRQLRYSPTRPHQTELISKGLTPVGQNFAREAVVVDALTFGKATSDFTRLSTLRIVFDAIQLVRRVAEKYVGYPATMHHRNAMDTAIGSALRGMLILGALIDADYNISYAPRENRAIVDLVLTPAFEMRNIEVSISIRL